MTHVRFTPEEIAEKLYEAQTKDLVIMPPWEYLTEGTKERYANGVRSLIEQGVIAPGEAHVLPLKHGDSCPKCNKEKILAEEGSSGSWYLYCPGRGCGWTQNIQES